MIRLRALSRNVRMARLLAQFEQARVALDACRTPPALVGSLALRMHRVLCDDDGIELLVDGDDADALHAPLQAACGYRCLHRDRDRAEYRHGGARLGLRFARHRETRSALQRSVRLRSVLGSVRVVRPEDLAVLALLGALPDEPAPEDRRAS